MTSPRAVLPILLLIAAAMLGAGLRAARAQVIVAPGRVAQARMAPGRVGQGNGAGVGGGGRITEYTRSLGAKSLDQAALDAEGYGEKKSFQRADDGLRIKLGPREQETGWRTPPQLRIGGNFTISANVVIKTLPKPAQEDGAAIGLAIAFGDIHQPDATLVRLLEPKGPDVYRSIEKASANPMMPRPMPGGPMPMRVFGGPPIPNPQKPQRRTFPAAGDKVRFELQREGQTIRYQVLDAKSAKPRYLGQVQLPPQDVAAVKIFASNRSGAEAVNVLLRDFTIHADRISGLGTQVRTVFDQLVYADPTAIENGILVVGGPPKPPKPKAIDPFAPGAAPTDVFAPADGPVAPAAAPAVAAAPVAAAAPAAAAPAGAAAPVAAAAPAAAAPVATAAPGAVVMVAPGAAPALAPGRAARAQQPPAAQKPKTNIPLDEIESIRFERSPMLTARLMGQPNLDFTMPRPSATKDEPAPKPDAKKPEATPKAEAKKDEIKKDEPKKAEAQNEETKKAAVKKEEAKKDETKKTDGGDDVLAPPPGTTITKIPKLEPKKNGIRDLHLALFGLRPAKIRQVMVNCQTDKGPTSWRLDTSDSQDWPLVIRRSGTEIAADLFLEPPPGDCYQKNFTINLNYEDGQAANANVQANQHSDPKLAVDPKAPAVPPCGVWVYLTGEEKLFGQLGVIGPETLRLTTPWQDHLDVPLMRIVGVHFSPPDRKESPESFAKRLKARGAEDLLLAPTKKGEVMAIPGVVEGTENDKLRFRYQGRTRTLPIQQVEGLVLAARQESQREDELRPTFSLASGVVISGRWKDLDSGAWKIETAWGQELDLPAGQIATVRFRGGKVTYLSDLNPTKVEEVPFFGHRMPWRRNVNLLGDPLKMDGRTYDRGLAVHSRCLLTYDLNGRYARFEALVGFDDAAKGKGRVDCRVFADGKELYANPDLRADGPPVKLAVPVAGAEQLRLVVDFGRSQDTGDRVIWANARLYRQAVLKVSGSTQ